MPFLLEHITEAVLWMMIFVFTSSALLIGITVLRRRRRESYFLRIDDLRGHFSGLVSDLLDGKADYRPGCDALDAITGKDRVHVLELLLLNKKPAPNQVPILRQLCQDLGLVEIWQGQLRGEEEDTQAPGPRRRWFKSPLGYLVRASGAQKLGLIKHQPSWPLLVNALKDDHPDVCTVAAASLAAIGEPESLEPILDKLHAVVRDPHSRVSARSLKMALVSFALDYAVKFLPSLQDSHPQIRYLAIDILREMTECAAAMNEDFLLNENTFPVKLSDIILDKLCKDLSPDVRARSAPLAAYMDDPRAVPALLTLLEDGQWYVRLNTVRALGKHRFISQAGVIASRLTDSKWMVREAAARTLLSFGQAGLDHVVACLTNTLDGYCKEQIADDLQRAGLVPAILSRFGENGESREGQVLRQFADLGKTSYLLAILTGSSDHPLRQKFVVNFGKHTDPQIQAWLKTVPTPAPHDDLRPNIPTKENAA